MHTFNIYIPLEKNLGNDGTLSGIASTVSIDRDGERMSDQALQDMCDAINNFSVNLFGNHEHQWENTLGVVKSATVQDRKLLVNMVLDDPELNPKVKLLMSKLARGIKIGLSVGGAILGEKSEYDKELGKKVKVIDRVKLYEISVVGIPSNADSLISIPSMIAKSAHSSGCPLCFGKMWAGECEVCLYDGLPESLLNNQN